MIYHMHDMVNLTEKRARWSPVRRYLVREWFSVLFWAMLDIAALVAFFEVMRRMGWMR